MEAPEDDVMIESELDLDDMIEENFELRDPGCSKSRHHKKINPERQCNHCEWTRQGTQQVFVHHILGEIQGLDFQIMSC